MFERFKTFFQAERKSTLANPTPELINLFGASPSAAGVSVTPENALRSPTVFGCVKVISESVAQLPLHLYRRDGANKERATDHPLYALLNDAPNEWTSSYEFRLQMQTAKCLYGNAFAFINRSGGRVVELIQIPSASVTVETDAATMEPVYMVAQGNGQRRRYSRDEIFHLRSLGTTANTGLSPVHLMREAIGLSIAMEQHAAQIFGSGARPAGLFKYAKVLGPEAMKRLRASFDSSHAGGANAGKTLILEDGMDFEPLQFTSVDLQFLEMRRHQVAEIARGFRVPLHMLQELERATHNNAESMGQQFLALTLLPELKAWEGAIRRSLLTPKERPDYFAEFMTDDLARADLAARFSAYAQAISSRILNPNEIRSMENRAPYPGGDEFINPNIESGPPA